VPEVAACGRSEGSDGHTPLPKRGPHLRKRTPSPLRPGRVAAQGRRVRERALWPEVVASPTGPRSSTQSPHHAKNRQNKNRSSPDRRPTPPSASRPYFRFLARPTPASLRVASMVDPPVSQHIPIHASHPPLPRCRRPAPAHQHPPGQTRPTFTRHVEEGGPAQRGGPPSSKAQAGSEEQAVGGAAARSRLRRTPRNEHQETNTKRRTGTRRPRYRVHAEAVVVAADSSRSVGENEARRHATDRWWQGGSRTVVTTIQPGERLRWRERVTTSGRRSRSCFDLLVVW
jgi:hypothetical protein